MNARYRAHLAGCGYSSLTTPPQFEIADGSRRRVETFEASATGFPKCAVAPAASHQTVIVIVEAKP